MIKRYLISPNLLSTSTQQQCAAQQLTVGPLKVCIRASAYCISSAINIFSFACWQRWLKWAYLIAVYECNRDASKLECKVALILQLFSYLFLTWPFNHYLNWCWPSISVIAMIFQKKTGPHICIHRHQAYSFEMFLNCNAPSSNDR